MYVQVLMVTVAVANVCTGAEGQCNTLRRSDAPYVRNDCDAVCDDEKFRKRRKKLAKSTRRIVIILGSRKSCFVASPALFVAFLRILIISY